METSSEAASATPWSMAAREPCRAGERRHAVDANPGNSERRQIPHIGIEGTLTRLHRRLGADVC